MGRRVRLTALTVAFLAAGPLSAFAQGACSMTGDGDTGSNAAEAGRSVSGGNGTRLASPLTSIPVKCPPRAGNDAGSNAGAAAKGAGSPPAAPPGAPSIKR